MAASQRLLRTQHTYRLHTEHMRGGGTQWAKQAQKADGVEHGLEHRGRVRATDRLRVSTIARSAVRTSS